MPDSDAEHDSRIDNLLNHLTYVRSLILTGYALVHKYPTPLAWEEAANSPTLLEGLESLSEVLSDVTQATMDALDEDEAAALSEQHHDRALDSLAEVSELLNVPAEDLVVVLLNG